LAWESSEGTFPDEEGTEIRVTPGQPRVADQVKEPSPMKRGLKLRLAAQVAPAATCEGTFPDEEGTEIEYFRQLGGARHGEGTFPDEEGTEISHSTTSRSFSGSVKEPSPMKRGLKLRLGVVQPVHLNGVKEPSPMKRGLKCSRYS